MNGFARTFWAIAAVALRSLAWLPIGAARGLNACADWCEQNSRLPSNGS